MSTIFIRKTTNAKGNKIHKVLLNHGYTNLQISDKGVTVDVEPDRIDKMISEMNDIKFGVAEKY